MPILNGKKTTAFPGLYVKSINSLKDSLIQFDLVNTAPTTASGYYYLYVDATGALVFNNGSTITTIGSPGAGVSATWDAIYAADKTLLIGGGTLTFAGNAATSANVLTITNVTGSTGAGIQITITDTSNPDIKGTADTWKVLGTGAATFLSATYTGSASGTPAVSLTAGDVILSDGQLSVTRVGDNAVTLTAVNNTVTSTSSIVFSGSGVFTGNTTSSFMTLTPSGLTTGTAFYLPVAGLTTGKAIHVVANAATDGLVVNVTSSATAMTSTGRLLNVSHSGSTSTSGVVAEVSSAAGDETVIFKVTASGALALGSAMVISGSSITTGEALTMTGLDSLTDGMGLHISSAATAMTATGRLLLVDHTGATGTSNVLVEFKTAATDETVVVKVTTAAMINGVGLSLVGTTGMTSGSLLRLTSSTAGALITNGVVSLTATGAFTSNSAIDGGFVEIKANSTTAGTILNLLGTALTTGVAVNISNGTAATTTGSLLRVAAGGTGAVATNGIVSFTHTGVYTSNSAVDGGFVEVKANSTTAGTVVNVVGSGLTTGIALQLSNGTSGMTSGSLFRATASGTGTIATNGIVSITHAGIFVSTANAGVLDVRASAVVGTGTLVNFMTTAASQLTTTVLNVENSGFTTGYTGSMLRVKSPTTTGACKVIDVIADGITSAGTAMSISVAALTTGVALLISNGTSGLTTGSLLKVTASGTGALATNGAVSITHAGAYTSTSTAGLLDVQASAATGTATVVNFKSTAAAQTAVNVLNVESAGYTTGYTGNVMTVTGVSTTGASNLLLLTGANTTAGAMLRLTNNALTTGVGAIFAHTTSVIASGGSLVRLSSSSVDTSTTTGVLLDLASTGSTSGTQILGTFSALTTGIGMSLVDSSADTSARQVALFSVTNTAAVLSQPIKTSNVAVTNSKFTKHIVMTDGTKTNTIWISQDGTTPNTTLSGTAGDICLNGPSSRMFYCTGTTNWTACNA